jgi:hypothetical protein
VLAVLLLIGSLLLSYFVIRKGVHHGILDADASRRAYDHRQRLEEATARGAGEDEPPPSS